MYDRKARKVHHHCATCEVSQFFYGMPLKWTRYFYCKNINIGLTIPGNWSFEIRRISWMWAFGWWSSIGLSFERPTSNNGVFFWLVGRREHLLSLTFSFLVLRYPPIWKFSRKKDLEDPVVRKHIVTTYKYC